MDDRYHYTIQPPVDFVNWVDEDSPIFGNNDPTSPREIEISLAELKEHNPKIIDWLTELDVVVYAARLFKSWPWREYRLHIDVDPKVDPPNGTFVYDHVIKLNFPFNSRGCQMSWYNLKPNSVVDCCTNASGFNSYSFNYEDCELIGKYSADKPCLLNAGRIHTLTNSRNDFKPRLCYSLMITKIDRYLTEQARMWNHESWQWPDAVKAFSPYCQLDDQTAL